GWRPPSSRPRGIANHAREWSPWRAAGSATSVVGLASPAFEAASGPLAGVERAASRPPGGGLQRAAPAQERAPRLSVSPRPTPARGRRPRLWVLPAPHARAGACSSAVGLPAPHARAGACSSAVGLPAPHARAGACSSAVGLPAPFAL